MNAYLALTVNGFREARRNRVTVVVAAFAAALVLSATLFTEATVMTVDRVLVDVGLGSMSLMLAGLVIFLSSAALSREIERRTIFLVVSKPVSRGLFLLSRLSGLMLTLAVLIVGMGALLVLELLAYKAPVGPPQWAALGMLWFELLVVSSVGVAISSFAGQMVSAFVTAGVYVAGHLVRDIYTLAERTEAASLKTAAKAVYYLLPNLERLNYRPHATYQLTPALSEVLASMAYALCYSGILLTLAVIIFERRDFK
jgi:ABC-type transport system involved in multi-copper enzyme maturation permease subunit